MVNRAMAMRGNDEDLTNYSSAIFNTFGSVFWKKIKVPI